MCAAEIEGRGGIVPIRHHILLHDFHCLAFVHSLKNLTIARVGRMSGGPCFREGPTMVEVGRGVVPGILLFVALLS